MSKAETNLLCEECKTKVENELPFDMGCQRCIDSFYESVVEFREKAKRLDDVIAEAKRIRSLAEEGIAHKGPQLVNSYTKWCCNKLLKIAKGESDE